MLQNPTVGIKHAALHLPAFAQAITSFTTQHTHAYQLTAFLVANSALAWLQAKPSRSLEDGKWEMGDRGMRILKEVSKQGRRPRPTRPSSSLPPNPNSHFPSRISQFPFAFTLCFTPTEPVIWGRIHTLGSMFNSGSGTDIVNTRYTGNNGCPHCSSGVAFPTQLIDAW